MRIHKKIVPTITRDASEAVNDQAYVNFIEVCIREIPDLTVSSKKILDGNVVYEITSHGMRIRAVAGRNMKMLSVMDGPVLLLTWRLPMPFPFLENAHANVTYFDLTYHVSSFELSWIAWNLRQRIEANGIRITRFRYEKSGNSLSRAVRFSFRRSRRIAQSIRLRLIRRSGEEPRARALDLRSISFAEALELIVTECHEPRGPWMDDQRYSPEWFLCTLESKNFQELLVFDGGRPDSLWQEFADGSYEISKVAIGLWNYSGNDTELLRCRDYVLAYEKRMEAGEFPLAYCLVRVGESGRITLFETNKRALALYLHCFVERKGVYEPIKGILAQVQMKLPRQSQ